MTLDLDDLFARNRALFGDLRMEATDDDAKTDDDAASADDADSTDDDAATAEDKAAEEKAAADALGDAGKQALDRMKEKLKKERAARNDAEKALADSKKPEDDGKVDVEAIKREARAEAETEALRDRVMDKIEAKAGGKFGIDTEDVAALLMRRHDLEDFLDDGKIDVEAIQSALSDLLDKQPALAAVAQGDEKKFKGSADAGARGKAGKPQLTRDDVETLAKAGKHAEIEQARVDGRLNDALGIK